MDSGKGYFEQYKSIEELIEKNPDKDIRLGVFQRGEKLQIKGSLFTITRIIRNGLKLRLEPKDNQANALDPNSDKPKTDESAGK